jgi:peptidoglycan hydrolase-like protein with peptidoglycan-binding domain
LAPDQVIANVQSVLQELGYYPYAVDGVLGPATQAAIAEYQRDNGLSVTAAIDRPTLASMGFIY